MLYIIEISPSNENGNFNIICDLDAIRDVAWLLQSAVFVRQFKVTYSVDTLTMPSNVGLSQANFPKWVTKFTYPKY